MYPNPNPLAIGDRLIFSPSGGGGRDYVKNTFAVCSLNPPDCLKAALSGDSPPPPPPSALNVPGEGPVRFISSKFKLLHAAKMSRWRATKWGEDGVNKLQQATDIFNAVKALAKASAASKGVSCSGARRPTQRDAAQDHNPCQPGQF